MVRKPNKLSKTVKKPVSKTKDLLATQSMLDLTEKKIKYELRASEKRLESKINQVESKINQVESKMEMVLSEVQRVALLMEEQNSRNKFVLDGYATLVQKIEHNESIVDEKIKLIESVILKKTIDN